MKNVPIYTGEALLDGEDAIIGVSSNSEWEITTTRPTVMEDEEFVWIEANQLQQNGEDMSEGEPCWVKLPRMLADSLMEQIQEQIINEMDVCCDAADCPLHSGEPPTVH